MSSEREKFNILKNEKPLFLIIEDGKVLTEELGPEYQIMTVSSEAEARDYLKTRLPQAILIALSRRNDENIDFCRDLLSEEEYSKIPVILFLDRVTEYEEIRGLEAGANDVLDHSTRGELLRIRANRVVLKRSQSHFPSKFLQRVDDAVFQHFRTRSFQMEDLAEYLNMDRKTLYRKVKTDSGKTTQEYIRHLRICRAGHLLKRGTMTIAEVAEQVGFRDISYFSKCFRDYFSISPSDFVKKYT